VVIRVALGIAAVAAGIAGDLLGSVHWPLVGSLEPSRVVLLCSGIAVFLSAGLVRDRGPAGPSEPAIESEDGSDT